MSSIYDYMTNILIYNKNHKRIGTLSNGGADPQAPYYDDLFVQELDTGADTFQFSTMSTPYTQDLLEIGNHVGFIYKNRFEYFTITSLEYSHYEGYKTIGVYAEGIGFELLDVFMERPELPKEDEDEEGNKKYPNNIYIDENGNIIYDPKGNYEEDEDKITIDGNGNIIYNPSTNKKKNNDSLEFKNISYPRFLNILLKNTGWSFVCQPGLESVKHNISVRYDTNIYAILQDSMQAFRGVELEFCYEGSPQNGGNSAAVRKIIKAYKDGGRGSFVGKRFEYGTNVRGITKTQEVTDSEDDTVIRVDNVGVDVYYDIDFALKSAEIPEIEIGDTHYVIDRQFCPPMTIKARIGKIEISFSDPTKNKITVANTKKIRGAAVDEEDINSTVKNLDDIINDGIDDYNDNNGDDGSSDGNHNNCIKNYDAMGFISNFYVDYSLYVGYHGLGDDGIVHEEDKKYGNILVQGGENGETSYIYPEKISSRLFQGDRAYLRQVQLTTEENFPDQIITEITANAENGIDIERFDGEGAKVNIYGELYVTEGVKSKLIETNTIKFSDGTEMTTAGSGSGGEYTNSRLVAKDDDSLYVEYNSSGLLPSTNGEQNLGVNNKRWNAGCINEVFSKGMETNRIESCLYLLPFDSDDMNSVKQITDSSSVSKQNLLDFITKEINVYEYIYTGDCNTDAGESGPLFNSLSYLGVLSKDFKSQAASLTMSNMTSDNGTVTHNAYNLPSLVTALIGAFQQHVANDGGGSGSGEFGAVYADYGEIEEFCTAVIRTYPDNPMSDNYVEFRSDIRMFDYEITAKEYNKPSDKSMKENIRYIDDLVKLTDDDLLDKADLHDFIVNQVNLCEYNFIGDTSNKIGFIANDYEGTKVGDKIVSRNGENNTLTYSPDNLLFATIGALQEEVRMRDEKIASLEARLTAIEEMLNNK